jgi:hypothetical protein
LELVFYGAGLSKRYRPDSSATYMEPYMVMAWWAFQKNSLISLSGMLEPWIMAHNPWKKKMPCFIPEKAIKRRLIFSDCQMEADNIKALGFNNPLHHS